MMFEGNSEGPAMDASPISGPKRVSGSSEGAGARHPFREASGHLGIFRPPI